MMLVCRTHQVVSGERHLFLQPPHIIIHIRHVFRPNCYLISPLVLPVNEM